MSDTNLLCAKCGSRVSQQEGLISDGYFAYCEECDEDLYSIETYKVKKQMSKMKKLKKFIVFIKQHYEPKIVEAADRDEAEWAVQNSMSWGEPIDVEITAEEEQ